MSNAMTNAIRAHARMIHFLDGAERAYPEEFSGGNWESHYFWLNKARKSAATLARNLALITDDQREYLWQKYNIDHTAY